MSVECSFSYFFFFFFNDTATTEIYTVRNTLSLHDALPSWPPYRPSPRRPSPRPSSTWPRSEEHTSELQSLRTISYAVFCLKKKKNKCTRPRQLSDPPRLTQGPVSLSR